MTAPPPSPSPAPAPVPDRSRAVARAGARWALRLALFAAAMAGLFAADRAIYRAARVEGIAASDLYQIFRQLGDLRTWLAVSIVIYLLDRDSLKRSAPLATAAPLHLPPAHHRAGLVMLSALVSGLAAEALKLLFRRVRPGETALVYEWRPFTLEPWQTSGLSLPSGHTAVAFGACVMLGLLFAPIRWVMLGLATGCGVSRVLAGAHYPTDVLMAAGVAGLIALCLRRAGARMHGP